ncbi:CCR4-NOT transcription complex subunit 9-like isoform X1 [Manihot esculenta]|uniref:CCR4-NOT transcription complex subunit 9-like isoform X1 n=1 Tax=Manihot esculenta TaxID=3983 RepID=UPI001CC7B136|nr:CCR4-NOT transcription complex subunit 9-like isoform X1 [Manihot esculenta]XP_043805144.1 CCR4-NOT transcription complex subunit 9-like isoform X1 [Manihot esculenta]XP_043805145.1 CCR4-NOT transcription complex subunit 9-like isoform X1 [Manihot esculenta]XP_043805146.1 CCR4-NOT transcription complex subunit 9-like isoform X1 [Manihot esculenta]
MHHESLRHSSLVVLEALVKVDDAKVIGFFLKYDMITSFLNCMEFGGALSRTTATFIVHRILLNKDVFSHCDQAGRFLDILRRLELMINELAKGGSFAEDTRKQLLQQIILCYHRLLENPGLLNANTVALHIFICNFIFCIYMLCEIEWQCIC